MWQQWVVNERAAGNIVKLFRILMFGYLLDAHLISGVVELQAHKWQQTERRHRTALDWLNADSIECGKRLIILVSHIVEMRINRSELSAIERLSLLFDEMQFISTESGWRWKLFRFELEQHHIGQQMPVNGNIYLWLRMNGIDVRALHLVTENRKKHPTDPNAHIVIKSPRSILEMAT